MEPPVRIALTTARLQGECSAAELRRRGGPGQNRTDDIQLAKLALSQLSYRPDVNNYSVVKDFSVERGGFEPPTFSLSERLSNQLI